ncbi:MAG: DUF6745 domain-containing protein [Opitutales bacterium]
MHRLSDAQFAQLEPWIENWITGAFRTRDQVQASHDQVRHVVQAVYRSCGFEPPTDQRIFVVRSPTEAAITVLELFHQVGEAPARGRHGLRAEDFEPLEGLRPERVTEPLSAAILRRYPWSPYQVCFHRVQAASQQLIDTALFGDKLLHALHVALVDNPDKAELLIPENLWVRLQGLTRSKPEGSTKATLDTERSQLLWHPKTSALPFLSFFRDVAAMDLDFSALAPVELLFRNISEGWHMRGLSVVSELPVECHHDANLRLHCETGPAMRWADGTAIYAWHGKRVRPRLITHCEDLTAETIEAEPNLTTRRVMLELFGEARFIASINAKKIHEDEFGVLYRRRLKETNRIHYAVKVVNSTPEPDGTFKDYFLNVRDPRELYPKHPRTARAAIASTFRDSRTGSLLFKTPGAYAPDRET